MQLKFDTEIIEAKTVEYGRELPVLDAHGNTVWLAGYMFGPNVVILADSFESAWEEFIDESPTISEDEVPRAYGFKDAAEFERVVQDAQDGVGEWPDLIGGYEYQSNATGTGIVALDYTEWVREYDPKHDREQVNLQIRRYE